MFKVINSWFKNRFLAVTQPKGYKAPINVEELIKEVVFTSIPLEKIPTYGPEERLVAFHIGGVPVLGEQAGAELLGFKYHELNKIPPFQQHLPFIVTMYSENNPTYKFYALEKEDMNEIGNGLIEKHDVLWVGIFHREHWLQIWNYMVGAIEPASTIDRWYPNATEEEIEASRF